MLAIQPRLIGGPQVSVKDFTSKTKWLVSDEWHLKLTSGLKTHTHTQTYTDVQIYTDTHTETHINIHRQTHKYTHIHNRQICIPTHVNVNIHTHTCILYAKTSF